MIESHELDFRSPVDKLVDRLAEEAQAEIRAMAEHARRSNGQLTRRDNFWRRCARERIRRGA